VKWPSLPTSEPWKHGFSDTCKNSYPFVFANPLQIDVSGSHGGQIRIGHCKIGDEGRKSLASPCLGGLLDDNEDNRPPIPGDANDSDDHQRDS